MTTTTYPNAPEISAEDYILVGLATCFIKDDGEVHQVQIIEPIPSAALESLLKGTPTSYRFACGKKMGEVLEGDSAKIPAEFPASAQFCDDFGERAIAAARTYQRRPEAAKFIPPGTTYSDFNHSVERKRVLNSERIIRTEDNVKQHEYTHKVL